MDPQIFPPPSLSDLVKKHLESEFPDSKIAITEFSFSTGMLVSNFISNSTISPNQIVSS